ncbi:hypothetical protein B0H12DRAFT_1231951 [Mycena haematopus]|nr:hypothetical protein B0H12DRAFT_1231951 [Mycena haematopus]
MADPSRKAEYLERARAADKVYKEKNRKFLAYKAREKRKEKAVQKLGPVEAQKQAKRRAEKRDYALEYAVLMAKRQDEVQEKEMAYVELSANQLFASLVTNVDLDSILTLTMSSAFKCSPPFHPDPGATQASATAFYLVSSPLAGDKRGIPGPAPSVCLRTFPVEALPSIAHGRPVYLRGMRAVMLASTLTPACLSQPFQSPNSHRSPPPWTAPFGMIPTQRTWGCWIFAAAWHVPFRSHPCTSVLGRFPPLLPTVSSPGPRPLSEPLLPTSSSAPMRSYVVQGRGTIYTSLEAALVDFRAAGAAGSATLYMTDDTAVAWNVAMGRSPEEANRLRLAEAVSGMVLDEALTMPPDVQKELDRLRDLPDDETAEWEDDDNIALEDVLDGTVPITISHGGGEIADMERELSEELHGKKKRKRKDTRNRWDVLQRRVNGFRAQMEAMVDAFTKFTVAQEGCMDHGPPPVPPEMIEQEFSVMVIDIFNTYSIDVPMTSEDKYVASCLACPSQMPGLGIDAWIKTLSDLHGSAFKPYSCQQFTTCFDLYLEILQNVELRVKKALGRDADDWRLKNGCPACTYKLEGEEKMIFEMLCACDGNDSLKRILRKDKGVDEDGVPLRGDSQRPDPRAESAGGDYFLTREAVNRWVKERLAAEVKLPTNLDPEEESVCQERWKNLSEELTSKSDMVRSGELAKYPLAIENALMDAFGKDIGLGYDIGCGHETTIKNSR